MRKPNGIALVLTLAAFSLAGIAHAQNPANNGNDGNSNNGSSGRGDTTSGPDVQSDVTFRNACTISSNSMAVCSFDDKNEGTELTFNQPVRIPGKVLEPGTYWFTLKNPDIDRDTVQILDRDRRNVASIRTIPTDREKATEKTALTFTGGDGHAPLTLVKWFYHGEFMGHEFVYPGQEAKAIREQMPVTVMAEAGPRLSKRNEKDEKKSEKAASGSY